MSVEIQEVAPEFLNTDTGVLYNPNLPPPEEPKIDPFQSETTIAPKPRKTIKDVVAGLKDKFPKVFDSRTSKALKNDVFNQYLFTPEAKKVIQDKARIQDTSPQFEQALRIGKYTADEKTETGAPVHKKGEMFAGIPDHLFYGKTESLTKNPLHKSNVEVKNYNTEVPGHEFIHVLQDQNKIDLSNFNQQWDAMKAKFGKKVNAYNDIDQNIGGADVYSGIDQEHLAAERHAYLGEALGRKGLLAIPKDLRKYYKGIFAEE